MSVQRFLISTALPDFRLNDRPVLFLGEWCKIFHENEYWNGVDTDLVPYIWDDRKKLYEDYLYITDLYEKLLPVLTKKMNTIHGETHSERFWRILIGPWLLFFLHIIFERWSQTKKAEKEFDISGTYIAKYEINDVVPFDMVEFAEFFVADYWNQFIYSYLIKNETNISFAELDFLIPRSSKPKKSFIAKMASKFRDTFFKLLERDNKNAFINLSLSRKEQFRLLFKFGIWSKQFDNLVRSNESFEPAKRSWILELDTKNAFEKFLLKFIPLQIPLAYIEGYNNLIKKSSFFNYPTPELILTSYIHFNDLFKVWVAKCVEKGSKLFIAQHGGTYGIAKWFSHEDHEIKIADQFLSWGWENKDQKKVIGFGMIKENPFKSRIGYDQSALLLVTGSLPRFSYKVWSETVAGQWLNYFSDQLKFIKSLPEPIKNKLLVKPYPIDNGWEIKERFKNEMSNIKFVQGNLSFATIVADSRIVVTTYNSTTFLESLSCNIPTIIFWDPEFWEIREDASIFFEELRSVGIFHLSSVSAAAKVNEVWNNVNDWWEEEHLQAIVLRFVKNYCSSPIKPLDNTLHLLSSD